MAGHRKGKMGQAHILTGLDRSIKLINSAMDNARQRYDTIDPEEMVITHLAAHRGQISQDSGRELVARRLPRIITKSISKYSWNILEKRKRKRIS